jgi:hypothetical protein
MHFNVDARPAEIPALLRRFTQIAGAAAWQKRETDFELQIRDNPLIDGYLDSHFPLERAMVYVRHYNSNTGRIPEINSAPHADLGALYSFVALIARVFPKLPAHGQNVLRGRISGALKDNVGLSPLAFEMRTVAHLMARGFDVEFHDLCEGGGYDFLAKDGEIALEVECKSVSGDLGHRVHLQRQYLLIPYILDKMQTPVKSGIVRLLVAKVPDRLHGNHEFLRAVATTIGQALEKLGDVADGEACTVSYHELPILGSPFDCESPPRITENDVIDYCNRMIGDEVGHTIMTFSPRQSATIIALRSMRPNYPLKAVYRSLTEAARQLSGSRPGVICVQFRNMTSAELRDLAGNPAQSGEPTGIQLMTAKFYDSLAHDHVHTIAYVAPGTFVRHQSLTLDSQGVMRTTRFSEDASSYVFTNKSHPDLNDRRYDIFK